MKTLLFVLVTWVLAASHVGVKAGEFTICDKKTAIQSSTGEWAYPGYAERAVDSITSPDVMNQGCTHTDRDDPSPWLLVDLGCEKTVNSVIIVNRNDTPRRLQKFVISVHRNLPRDPTSYEDVCTDHAGALGGRRHVLPCDEPMTGRFVVLRFKNPGMIDVEDRFIHVCDVAFE